MAVRKLVRFALLVAATTVLCTAMFLRDPLGAEPQKRMPHAPMIVVAARMVVEPGGRMPLLIEVGPPQWVPDDSTLLVRGLPATVHLSPGQRLSADLWSVPVSALSGLTFAAGANAVGGWNLQLRLVGGEGNLLAEATTTISISAPAVAAADAAARQPPPDASGVGSAVPLAGAAEPVESEKGRENPRVVQGVALGAKAASDALRDPMKASRQPATGSSRRRASRTRCGSQALRGFPRKGQRTSCRHGSRRGTKGPGAKASVDMAPTQMAGRGSVPDPAHGALPRAATGLAAALVREQASPPADPAPGAALSQALGLASAARIRSEPGLLASALETPMPGPAASAGMGGWPPSG